MCIELNKKKQNTNLPFYHTLVPNEGNKLDTGRGPLPFYLELFCTCSTSFCLLVVRQTALNFPRYFPPIQSSNNENIQFNLS